MQQPVTSPHSVTSPHFKLTMSNYCSALKHTCALLDPESVAVAKMDAKSWLVSQGKGMFVGDNLPALQKALREKSSVLAKNWLSYLANLLYDYPKWSSGGSGSTIHINVEPIARVLLLALKGAGGVDGVMCVKQVEMVTCTMVNFLCALNNAEKIMCVKISITTLLVTFVEPIFAVIAKFSDNVTVAIDGYGCYSTIADFIRCPELSSQAQDVLAAVTVTSEHILLDMVAKLQLYKGNPNPIVLSHIFRVMGLSAFFLKEKLGGVNVAIKLHRIGVLPHMLQYMDVIARISVENVTTVINSVIGMFALVCEMQHIVTTAEMSLTVATVVNLSMKCNNVYFQTSREASYWLMRVMQLLNCAEKVQHADAMLELVTKTLMWHHKHIDAHTEALKVLSDTMLAMAQAGNHSFQTRHHEAIVTLLELVLQFEPPPTSSTFNALVDIRAMLLRISQQMNIIFCAACYHSQTLAQCSKCRTVHYCSKACQVVHWATHKPHCVAPERSSIVLHVRSMPACSVCFIKLNKRLLCSACKLVCYCSVQCQRTDWPVHKHLCAKKKEKEEDDKEEEQEAMDNDADPTND